MASIVANPVYCVLSGGFLNVVAASRGLEPWLSSLSGLSGPVGPLSGPVGGSVGLTGLTAVGAPVGWVSGPVGDLSIFLTATMCVPCRGLSGLSGTVGLSGCR